MKVNFAFKKNGYTSIILCYEEILVQPTVENNKEDSTALSMTHGNKRMALSGEMSFILTSIKANNGKEVRCETRLRNIPGNHNYREVSL